MESESRRRRKRSPGSGRIIAVTGVHGSLGTRLLRRLDDDPRVSRLVLLDRAALTAPLLKAASYRVDLTEPNADGRMAEILRRENVSTVVHLAFHRRPQGDPAAAHELESVGTMHLIGALAQCTGVGTALRHLLVVTTGLVYGAHQQGPAVMTERSPLRGCPGYPFVGEKVDAERQLEVARVHLSSTPITVLRPSLTLSAGDDGIGAAYFRSRVLPTIWGYDPLLQLIHEEDLVAACCAAIDRRPDGAYNVAGAGALPLGTLIRLARKVELPLLACAAPLAIDALWHVGVAPFPGAHAPYLRYPVVLDGKLAARDLGFQPRRSTAETLEHFLGRRLLLAA
jgi:UDP-glucose 4-epimerase